MTLFDADKYIDREPVVDVIPVCDLCGAHGPPIPSSGAVRKDGWWEGVAFAIIDIAAHKREMHPELA